MWFFLVCNSRISTCLYILSTGTKVWLRIYLLLLIITTDLARCGGMWLTSCTFKADTYFWVWSQPDLHSETLSQKHETKQKSNSFSFIFMCEHALLACMDVHHMHAWYLWRPERVSAPLEPEFQGIVSHHVTAGNWSSTSSTAAGAPNHWLFSSATRFIFKEQN